MDWSEQQQQPLVLQFSEQHLQSSTIIAYDLLPATATNSKSNVWSRESFAKKQVNY